jgi:hypothetical protein
MSKKYLLTSTRFTGSVEFTYNHKGYLTAFLVDSEMTDDQLGWLLNHFPFDERAVTDLRNASPTLCIKDVDSDLSFESFWNRFGKKIHPNRCEPLWKKLTDGKKTAALATIAPYDAYLSRTGTYKVSPENYIKKEYWKTDWSKE